MATTDQKLPIEQRETAGASVIHDNEKRAVAEKELRDPASSSDDVIDLAEHERVDPEVAAYASAKRVEIDFDTNKRLKRLVDKRVLSIMIFTYFLQALDKGTMSFAAIMGIREDNHLLDGQKFSWLTTCIYLAVLLVEFPTNVIITKVPIAKYLGINIMLWSTILCLHSVTKNFTGLVILRTLLGVFEACCQPTFVLLSSMWYRREEQAATVAYWYMMNGGQQIVGGLLAYCFSLLGNKRAIKSWQALFITYGCASFLWGIFVIFYMPDSPMRAKCFSEEDKKLMVERVRENQTGVQNRKFRKYQIWEALKDHQTYCYFLIQVCTTLPTSGLGGFSGIIIKSFHYTVLQTQLLAMVLGAYLIIILLSSAWASQRWGHTTLLMAIYVLPSIAGTIVLLTVANDGTVAHKAGLLCSYYITLSFWASATLGLSMVSRNVAGQTKKSVIITINFLGWCTGNSIGPQVFLTWDAPKYRIAFLTHMGCYALLILTIFYLRFYLSRQNKTKDRLQAEGVLEKDEKLTRAFDDLTDKENPQFRYQY